MTVGQNMAVEIAEAPEVFAHAANADFCEPLSQLGFTDLCAIYTVVLGYNPDAPSTLNKVTTTR